MKLRGLEGGLHTSGRPWSRLEAAAASLPPPPLPPKLPLRCKPLLLVPEARPYPLRLQAAGRQRSGGETNQCICSATEGLAPDPTHPVCCCLLGAPGPAWVAAWRLTAKRSARPPLLLRFISSCWPQWCATLQDQLVETGPAPET